MIFLAPAFSVHQLFFFRLLMCSPVHVLHFFCNFYYTGNYNFYCPNLLYRYLFLSSIFIKIINSLREVRTCKTRQFCHARVWGGKRRYQLLSWTHLSMNTTLDFTPHAREWMLYMYGVICESFLPLEHVIRVLYECFRRDTWVTFCNMRQPLGSHAREWGSDRITASFLSTPVCVIETWCIIPA